MEIEKNVIAAKVGSATGRAERSADLALADAATLLGECARARAFAGLPAHEGQRSILSLGKAVAQLINVQGELRRAHAENSRLSQVYGLAPDEDDCPWPATTGEANETITVAEMTAA